MIRKTFYSFCHYFEEPILYHWFFLFINMALKLIPILETRKANNKLLWKNMELYDIIN